MLYKLSEFLKLLSKCHLGEEVRKVRSESIIFWEFYNVNLHHKWALTFWVAWFGECVGSIGMFQKGNAKYADVSRALEQIYRGTIYVYVYFIKHPSALSVLH